MNKLELISKIGIVILIIISFIIHKDIPNWFIRVLLLMLIIDSITHKIEK